MKRFCSSFILSLTLCLSIGAMHVYGQEKPQAKDSVEVNTTPDQDQTGQQVQTAADSLAVENQLQSQDSLKSAIGRRKDTTNIQPHDSLKIDKPLTIDLNAVDEEEEEEELPKKKRKRNTFYDIKTKKAYAKSGFGQSEKIEIFYVLKKWEDPDPYVRDIYWYDKKSKSVKKGGSPTEEKGMLLHGPYRIERNDVILEEGIFYKGAKHGRWNHYRKMYDYMVLERKEKYVKGWPKESKITYYDKHGQQIKEVIPVEYGKKEGYYYYFFPTGALAVRGEFQYDEKVGTWTEYYNNRQRRKKQVQYAPNPWEKNFSPFIAQEWDKDGKLIYERK